MRVLLLGGGGMLGSDLRVALAAHDVKAPTRLEVDLLDPAALISAAQNADIVINAAAYTDVDAAESDEETATRINGRSAGDAAGAAASAGARFIQISTDYVFRGDADSPYPEDAARDPQNAYGRSKAAGELAVLAAHPSPLIVRTAWLYGAHGRNFPRTVLALATRQETVSIVDDQRGQPTWTSDVAASIVSLVEAGPEGGIFHATNAGETTWFGLAREVFRLAGLDPERVLPTDSDAFRRPAVRPTYSVLGHDAWHAAGLLPPRAWKDALADAVRSGALEEH